VKPSITIVMLGSKLISSDHFASKPAVLQLVQWEIRAGVVCVGEVQRGKSYPKRLEFLAFG